MSTHGSNALNTARRAWLLTASLAISAAFGQHDPKAKLSPDEVRQQQVEEVFRQIRGPLPQPGTEIVYGIDDRRDRYEVEDLFFQQAGDAVCIITSAGNLVNNGDGTYSLPGVTRWNSQSGLPLCPDTPFQNQLRFGFCTGFLVGPDLIATAGHCVQGDVSGLAYIFDFNQEGPTTGSPGVDEIDPDRIPAHRVYFAGQAEPIVQKLDAIDDYGLVRVDRPVRNFDDTADRQPLVIRREGQLSVGQSLYLIGHGSGLPKKFDAGGKVTASDPQQTFFQTDADAFSGNSGSPVINASTGAVEGILVRGNPDYDFSGGCAKPAVCPQGGCTTPLPPFEEAQRISSIAQYIPASGLQVTPTFGTLHLAAGGALSPDSVVYTISNLGTATASYSITFVDGPGTFDLVVDPPAAASGSVPPGGSVEVLIRVDSSWETLPPGTYTRAVRFNDDTAGTFTTRVHTLEIDTTGFTVTPRGDIRFSGPVGGPFTPPGPFSYTIRSTRPTPVSVLVFSDVPWLRVNGEEFTVVLLEYKNDAEAIELSINAAAVPSQGEYLGTISFVNLQGGGGDTTRSAVAEVGRSTYAATDVPQIIADQGPAVISTIQVPDAFCLADVDVSLNISHSAVGDLIVDLTSPSGVTVRLHNNSGGLGSALVATYDQDAAPGTTLPDGPGSLDEFDNRPASGTWTLRVQDTVFGDSGILNAWSLRLLPKADCTPLASPEEIELTHTLTQSIDLDGESFIAEPLGVTIVSLPQHATLLDPGVGPITSVPYVVQSGTPQTLWIAPESGYLGIDQFEYIVSDSASDSEVATQVLSFGRPEAVASFELDANPGWLVNGQWAFGVPLGSGSDFLDPTSGFTGTNVYGYNLAGDYADNLESPQALISETVDFSGYVDPQIRFRRWLGIETGTFDKASIQASVNNGVSWSNVWLHDTGSPTLVDDQWVLVEYPLPPNAGGASQVRIQWTLGPTDESVTYPGWNIDDVEFLGIRVPIQPCNADFNQDDQIDFGDFLAFFNAFDALAPVADVDASGTVDFGDFLLFFNIFDASACSPA